MIKDVRVFVDGFLVFEDLRNGCSVCVEKAVSRTKTEQLFFSRYLLENLKNKKLRELTEKNVITNFVVEYFAMYVGILVAKKFDADYLYSDAKVIVKQMKKKNYYKAREATCKVWVAHLRNLLEGTVKPEIHWIGRAKMVKTLGH